jgi:hypothetical protein
MSMLLRPMDYRDLVKAEFLRRKASDPFYCLRRFAKDLSLEPMHVSYLLKHKRGLSKNNALHVASVLGLKGFAAQRFCFLVSAQSGRSKVERGLAKMGLQKKWIQEAKVELHRRLEE